MLPGWRAGGRRLHLDKQLRPCAPAHHPCMHTACTQAAAGTISMAWEGQVGKQGSAAPSCWNRSSGPGAADVRYSNLGAALPCSWQPLSQARHPDTRLPWPLQRSASPSGAGPSLHAPEPRRFPSPAPPGAGAAQCHGTASPCHLTPQIEMDHPAARRSLAEGCMCLIAGRLPAKRPIEPLAPNKALESSPRLARCSAAAWLRSAFPTARPWHERKAQPGQRVGSLAPAGARQGKGAGGAGTLA